MYAHSSIMAFLWLALFVEVNELDYALQTYADVHPYQSVASVSSAGPHWIATGTTSGVCGSRVKQARPLFRLPMGVYTIALDYRVCIRRSDGSSLMHIKSA